MKVINTYIVEGMNDITIFHETEYGNWYLQNSTKGAMAPSPLKKVREETIPQIKELLHL